MNQRNSSIREFGLEKHFPEGTKIYYYQFFSSDHLGRASDFILKTLPESFHSHEYQIRLQLTHSFFQNQNSFPIQLEIATLEDQIGIFWSFPRPSIIPQYVDKIQTEIEKKTPWSNPIHQLLSLCSHIEINVIQKNQFALLTLWKTSETSSSLSLQNIEYIEIAEIEDSAKKDYEFVHLSEVPDPAEKTSSPKKEGLLNKVFSLFSSKDKDHITDEIKISGTTEKVQDEKIVVKGYQEKTKEDPVVFRNTSAQSHHQESKVTISSTTAALSESEEMVSSSTKEYQNQEIAPRSSLSLEEPTSEEEVTEIEKISGQIGDSKDIETALQKIQAVKQDIQQSSQDQEQKDRQKTFMDSMMKDLLSEKARLQQLSKDMNLKVRQQDLEFKNKERSLQSELKKAAQENDLKENQLIHLKKQIHELRERNDQLKDSQSKLMSEQEFKQKVETYERIAEQSKQQKEAADKRLEESKKDIEKLKAELNSQKSESKLQEQEIKTFKVRLEKAEKALQETKKTHAQLLTEYDVLKKEKSGAGQNGQEELQKKLSAAIQSTADAKKEEANLKIKLSEAQRQEKALKIQIEQLKQRLQKAQTATQKKTAA